MKKGLRKFVKLDDGTGRKLLLRTQYPCYVFELNPVDEPEARSEFLGNRLSISIVVRKDFHHQGPPPDSYLLEAIKYYQNDILKHQPESYVQPWNEEIGEILAKGLAPDNWIGREKPYDKQDLFELLNASYLADKCFHKSRQWFYQRVNNALVNGKRAEFSPKDKQLLADFLRMKANEILHYADDLIPS